MKMGTNYEQDITGNYIFNPCSNKPGSAMLHYNSKSVQQTSLYINFFSRGGAFLQINDLLCSLFLYQIQEKKESA